MHKTQNNFFLLQHSATQSGNVVQRRTSGLGLILHRFTSPRPGIWQCLEISSAVIPCGGMLLASSGLRPGMMLNMLQYIGRPGLQHRITWPQMPVVLWPRSFDLEAKALGWEPREIRYHCLFFL